jgi:hypothetical protein
MASGASTCDKIPGAFVVTIEVLSGVRYISIVCYSVESDCLLLRFTDPGGDPSITLVIRIFSDKFLCKN